MILFLSASSLCFFFFLLRPSNPKPFGVLSFSSSVKAQYFLTRESEFF